MDSKADILRDFRAKETATAKKWKLAMLILKPNTPYYWLSDELKEAFAFVNELSWQWKLLDHAKFMDEMNLWEEKFTKDYRPSE